MNPTKWLLGVTGGIAAYKTPELVRLLKKQGHEVKVVLSQGAKAFVTPLSLQAVSGNPVYSELLDTDFEAAMGHIELARWAQNILIAPLSANRLAALAHGMADDLLTTLCLASKAPLWVAPAMNQMMWEHPATQANLEILKARGVSILGPAWGDQACGEIGWGRMLLPEEIIQALSLGDISASSRSMLHGLSILITAGPTREAIDPVRFLSNQSSGKMGFALAQVAAALGAKVTLIAGPTSIPTPQNVERIDVVSAVEMQNAVISQLANTQIFISAAAVSDFRPTKVLSQKLKKENQNDFELSLVRNPDILASVGAMLLRPYCVGFAAETENVLENAQKKLVNKNIDLIAVNDVSKKDIGFNVNENALTIFSKEREYTISKKSKTAVAVELLTIISECYAKNKTQNS